LKKFRSKWPWFLAAIIVVIAVFIFSFQYSELKTVKEIRTKIPERSKEVSSGPSSSTGSVPVGKETDREPSCGEKVLSKIAGKCDNKCLFDHVKKTDPELALTLIEIDDPWSKSKVPAKSTLGRFIRAFNGIHSEPVNLLRQLAKEDPDNSYPAVYLASYLKSVEKPEEAKTVLSEALNRKRYHSYFTDYFYRLRKTTLDHPPAFARAMLFDMRVFRLNSSILWNLRDIDNDLYLKLGKLITLPGIRANGQDPEIHWSWEDYQFGTHIVEEADPTEGSFLPDYSELGQAYIDRNFPGVADADCKEENFYSEMARLRFKIPAK